MIDISANYSGSYAVTESGRLFVWAAIMLIYWVYTKITNLGIAKMYMPYRNDYFQENKSK